MKYIINNNEVEVSFQRKKIKRTYIKIIDDKHINISSAFKYCDDDIKQIIEKNIIWLTKKIKTFENNIEHEYYIFGYKSSYSLDKENESYIIIKNHFNEINSKYFHMTVKLVFRKMKSRWGSCFYKKNQITLNKGLIHIPLYLVDYVIYHEFIHFFVPNHSKDFYEILKKYVPNYKEYKKEIKKYNFCILDKYSR